MEQLQKDDRTWGTFVHLGGIIGHVLFAAGGNVIGALVIWLIRKNDSKFVDQEGKEAVNFQITIAILTVILSIINGIRWGFWNFSQVFRGNNTWRNHDWNFEFFSTVAFVQILWALNILFSILAAVQANKGLHYRYPVSWRLVK
ncbi:DUF4870 domain-containing protein [Chitinophaga sp. SYP-B3965]|uniref:DUF4870 domain-containing protein n=1 Tax=Chitinophaga sp. SYP-B3965 TaxID=2663120 RepID=UPI001299F25C|nr:DUF4870 domain-containing protein [Chitinophaga sp. SYP-B3965]MRG44314.1 DUF4870 domain-containing protein [Chitinophaga sp. SYP-B3965]